MNEYDITFALAPLDEKTENRILEELDCAVAGSHAAQLLIVVTQTGRSGKDAMRAAARALRSRGARIDHAQEDLVSKSEIANRFGVTHQAVGQWARGNRHADKPFPSPYNQVAGGVWLWGDVVEWYRQVHGPWDEGVAFVTRRDVAEFNAKVLSRPTATG